MNPLPAPATPIVRRVRPRWYTAFDERRSYDELGARRDVIWSAAGLKDAHHVIQDAAVLWKHRCGTFDSHEDSW